MRPTVVAVFRFSSRILSAITRIFAHTHRYHRTKRVRAIHKQFLSPLSLSLSLSLFLLLDVSPWAPRYCSTRSLCSDLNEVLERMQHGLKISSERTRGMRVTFYHCRQFYFAPINPLSAPFSLSLSLSLSLSFSLYLSISVSRSFSLSRSLPISFSLLLPSMRSPLSLALSSLLLFLFPLPAIENARDSHRRALRAIRSRPKLTEREPSASFDSNERANVTTSELTTPRNSRSERASERASAIVDSSPA